MKTIHEVLKAVGVQIQRGIYTARDRPKRYITYARIQTREIAKADDGKGESVEQWRVNVVCKGDFEELLEETKKTLRQAEYCINDVGAEIYDEETGYWMIPINTEILKEDENMTLGLRDLYYAVMEEQDGVETYETPEKLAEAMTAELSVNVAEGKLYADDAISEDVKKFTSGTIKLGIKELVAKAVAKLLGQKVDGNNVVWAGGDDEPPYVAIGFRAKKTGGKFKYVWLLKCKFKVPGEKYQTEGESITFNTPEIEGTILLNKDNRWKADIVAKETDAVAQTWFDAVQEYKEPEEAGAGGETEENIPTA